MATAVMLYSNSSVAQGGDNCVDYTWAKADKIQSESGANWNEWDFWDVTNVLYEDCINGEVN